MGPKMWKWIPTDRRWRHVKDWNDGMEEVMEKRKHAECDWQNRNNGVLNMTNGFSWYRKFTE